MKTLLCIDANIRINGLNTRALTDYFQSKWLSVNPGGRVIQCCLSSNPILHISHEMIKAFQHSSEQSNGGTLPNP